MCASKIFKNTCLIKQKTKPKNTFVNITYSVLEMKEFW